MKTMQYGDWKIAVDVDKTKEYYNEYKINDAQANRNFAEYCRNLNSEEKAFFDAFGINPVCCEIEHIGADKKGNFPCGGYYFVCGKYLEYPPEDLMTIEELAANDFIDERPDPRVDIGIFQFDFQCTEYECSNIPPETPEGFICIRFWCEEMKWQLSEEPEEKMYEPPRFWEIHKIIKERIDCKRQEALDLKQEQADFICFFENLNIEARALNKKEIEEHKKEWVTRFAPADADIKKIKKLCLNSRRYTPFLWHIFSFNFLNCEVKEKASELYDKQSKSNCIIINNDYNIALTLKNAEKLKSELLEQFDDVTITASDFTWTYTKTHEEMCGPYFYKHND